MIDNTIHHNTPEGIALSIVPAGIVLRIYAWFVDALVRGAIILGSYLLFVFLGQAGFGLILIIYFVVMWLYPVLFEVLRDGQTIGKRMFGIYVCMDNGMPIGWRASMIRNLLIVADFLPVGFFAGIVSMLCNKDAKRLGDLVAGTVVAYMPYLKEDYHNPNHPASTPPISLDLKEQTAILDFVSRLDRLPSDRAYELADILLPLTGKRSTYEAYQELLGYASTILGQDDKVDEKTRTKSKNKLKNNQSAGRKAK